MLKLRSSATATLSGKSPAENTDTVWPAPFSSISKSPRTSPVTGSPRPSVTLAYTSTTLTPELNCAFSGAHTAAASRAAMTKVLQSRLTRAVQGVFMGLGIPELIVILFIIILIFGASRLPEIGRGLGHGIRNFKDATHDGARKD